MQLTAQNKQHNVTRKSKQRLRENFMKSNGRGIKAKYSSTFFGSTKDPEDGESLPCIDIKDLCCHKEQTG